MGLKERRQRERAERRGQILAAARGLLVARGLEAISIGQIAKAAELGVGTIYFYFTNKEDIFVALQQEGLALLYDRIQDACRRTPSAREALAAAADAYLHFSREQKDYFDVINYFIASPREAFAPDLKSAVDEQGGRVLTLVVDIIVRGVRSGALATPDPRRHAVMFWATLHGLIQFRKFRGTLLRDDDLEGLYAFAVARLIVDLEGGKK